MHWPNDEAPVRMHSHTHCRKGSAMNQTRTWLRGPRGLDAEDDDDDDGENGSLTPGEIAFVCVVVLVGFHLCSVFIQSLYITVRNAVRWRFKVKLALEKHPFHARLIKKAGLSPATYISQLLGEQPDGSTSSTSSSVANSVTEPLLTQSRDSGQEFLSFVKRILQRLTWNEGGRSIPLDYAVSTLAIPEKTVVTLADTLAETLVMNARWDANNFSWYELHYLEVGRELPLHIMRMEVFREEVAKGWRDALNRRNANTVEKLQVRDSFSSVSPDDFRLGERLGHGDFGAVFKGTWDGKTIAVKKLDGLSEEENELAQLRREKEKAIHCKLVHRNVLRLYRCCTDPAHETHYLLMQYMRKGSLRDVLSRERLPWFVREAIAMDIASGLAYVHKNRRAHLNLKSFNVVVGDEYHAKLSDFGTRTPRYSEFTRDKASYPNSPRRWMAPEEFERRDDVPEELLRQVDIYAFGVIMWELCTRSLPKPKSPSYSSDEFRDEGYPPHFVKLAQRCCQENPDDRPEAEEIVEILRNEPDKIMERVFPKGIAGSHVKQHASSELPLNNCRPIAALHSLKNNPLAPSLFRRIITERSRISAEQGVAQCGWRVDFAFSQQSQSVDVDEEDLESMLIKIEGKDRVLNILEDGQTGDKILLVGASRWRQLYGLTDSVLPGVLTFKQGEHTRDTIEFLRLCLRDRIAQEFDIVSRDMKDPLSSLNCDRVYNCLNEFSEEPATFVLIAGTANWDNDTVNPPNRFLDPKHMYSVLATNSSTRSVTLANPIHTQDEVFTLDYEVFVQWFRRLAGIKLDERETQKTHIDEQQCD